MNDSHLVDCFIQRKERKKETGAKAITSRAELCKDWMKAQLSGVAILAGRAKAKTGIHS